MVAAMRQEGDLTAGSTLTAHAWESKFCGGANPETLDPSDPRNDQVLRLIAYLKQHDTAILASRATTATLDISA